MPASPARDATGQESRSLSAVIAAFGGVGVAATLGYFLLANLLSGLAGLSAVVASVCAYLVSAIFSYYGHKHWSFASKRAHAIAAPRFLVSTAIGLALAYLFPIAAEKLGLPATAAYGATCLIVPFVNFFLLSAWVFEAGLHGRAAASDEISLRRFRLVAGSVVVATVLASYTIIVWRWGINPDTSWLITVAERLGAGDRLYADIMEVNPPFSVWLYLPPVRFADMIGVAPEPIVRLYVLALCLAATCATGSMLARSRMLGRSGATGAALAMFAITALLSGNSFTERDQIGAVLALPLFVLASWRSRGPHRDTPVAAADWIVAGLGAGVFAMVKPYYAAVVLTVACLLALKRRDVRVFFLPEFVLSAALTLAYLLLSYMLYPGFFETFLPLLRETYMAFRWPLGILLLTAVPWLPLPVAYAFRRHLLNTPVLSDFFMIGALAAWIPYFFQGKAWAYHAYPATLFGCVALVTALAMLLERLPRSEWTGHLVIVAGAILIAHLRFLPTERPSEILIDAGLREVGNPTVGMLAGGIEKGHPLTRMIKGRWIEPYCSDWIPVYTARRIKALSASGDVKAVGRFKDMARRYYEEKRARLAADPPRLLIVDRRDGVVREMLSEFGFDKLLARYARIAADDGTELYRLKDDAIPDQPVSSAAASG